MNIEIFVHRHTDVKIIGNYNSIENHISEIELKDSLNYINQCVCEYII